MTPDLRARALALGNEPSPFLSKSPPTAQGSGYFQDHISVKYRGASKETSMRSGLRVTNIVGHRSCKQNDWSTSSGKVFAR